MVFLMQNRYLLGKLEKVLAKSTDSQYTSHQLTRGGAAW